MRFFPAHLAGVFIALTSIASSQEPVTNATRIKDARKLARILSALQDRGYKVTVVVGDEAKELAQSALSDSEYATRVHDGTSSKLAGDPNYNREPVRSPSSGLSVRYPKPLTLRYNISQSRGSTDTIRSSRLGDKPVPFSRRDMRTDPYRNWQSGSYIDKGVSSPRSRRYDFTYRPPVGDNWVRGYVRSDGTYVKGHMRTDRDDSFWNNYSSKGNRNPYTGRTGRKSPPR